MEVDFSNSRKIDGWDILVVDFERKVRDVLEKSNNHKHKNSAVQCLKVLKFFLLVHLIIFPGENNLFEVPSDKSYLATTGGIPNFRHLMQFYDIKKKGQTECPFIL